MKRIVLIGVGLLAMSAGTLAQAPAGNFDAALAAAPANMRDGAMVIKWKADGSYDTLRPGTNRLMCYDQAGDAGEAPISSQCTSVGNLERVKQNKIYEAKNADPKAREAAFAELEKSGQRVKPEFGSVFYTRSGKDATTVRMHVTIAVPGATAASLGIPDNNKMGGAWIMNAGTSTAHIMTPEAKVRTVCTVRGVPTHSTHFTHLRPVTTLEARQHGMPLILRGPCCRRLRWSCL